VGRILSYEKVISAVELVPDDYILKPFAPEVLRLRLEKVIQKKKAFLQFYVLREQRDHAASLAELVRMLPQPANAVYRYDILRSRAVLLLETGALTDAAATYQAIIAEYPFPWAKAGLARVHHHNQRHDEARAMVEEVIEQVPNYFDAYDLKAEICTRQGAFEEALKALAEAAPREAKPGDDEAGLSLECMAAVMDEAQGNERFDRMRAQIAQKRQFSVNAAIDITRAALHFSDLQLANLIAERIPSGPDARQAFTELLAIYRCENLEQPFRELQREIVSRKLVHHDARA
jgi:predicted Zn-dependent protease